MQKENMKQENMKQENVKQETTKKENSFYAKLFSLVLPIALQQFMLSLVSASDAVMLGQLNQNSMAAVSLAGQIMFVFNLFIMALTTGASMFAAQYWGKGDKQKVEQILGFVLRTSVLISLLFFLGAELLPEQLMRLFTPDIQLIRYGADYLRVVGSSYLFCGISQIYLCIMKNTGQAGTCTIISSAGVILNILFNAVLIFGLFGLPAMGIAGAALATVIARAAELLWAVLDSCRAGHLRFHIQYAVYIDHTLERSFWKRTFPALGNYLVWGGGITMYSVILGHLGSDAVAANSIASIAKNLIVCFCLGVGSGGSILIGHELGAGRLNAAKEYGSKLCHLSLWSGIASGLLLLLLSPLILRATALSAQAQLYLKWMLVISSYYLIGKSLNSTVVGGIFCAGGDSKFGFLCDGITLWCIILPLGCAAAFLFHWPVLAVYFILNLDEFIKLPAVYRHYKKYLWVKDLTK